MFEVFSEVCAESKVSSEDVCSEECHGIKLTCSGNLSFSSRSDAANAAKYLKDHRIDDLIQDLMTRLMSHQPLQPLSFLSEILQLKSLKRDERKRRRRSIPTPLDSVSWSKTTLAVPCTDDSLMELDRTLLRRVGSDHALSDSELIWRQRAKNFGGDSQPTARTPLFSPKTLGKDAEQLSDDLLLASVSSLPSESLSKKETTMAMDSLTTIVTAESSEIMVSISEDSEMHSLPLQSLSVTSSKSVSKSQSELAADLKDRDPKKEILLGLDSMPTTCCPRPSGPLPIRISSKLEFSSASLRPCFGIDIGGSLAKISFYEPTSVLLQSQTTTTTDGSSDIVDSGLGLTSSIALKAKFLKSATRYGKSGVRDLALSFAWKSGRFHFVSFETGRIEAALRLFKEERLVQSGELFFATGGGAHKYASLLRSMLGVRVRKGDEFQCLLRGLNFLLSHVPDEVYYLKDPSIANTSPLKEVYDIHESGCIFPYLLVNMGSGISILRVDSPTRFERVSGSCIGGGTYWGLCRLTVSDKLTWDESFALAQKGNAERVNMTVSDIYGGDYRAFGLKGDIVAAQFGKLGRWMAPVSAVAKEDVARALLDMISMNAAQLAYLNAVRQGVSRIIFAGNFLRQNMLAMAMISYAIDFWSQGEMKALFLKHEGYFGSIGVFLMPDSELESDD